MSVLSQIEALLLASPSPIPIARLSDRFGRDVSEEIKRLADFWRDRGMIVRIQAETVALTPSPACLKAISAAESNNKRKLSEAAIETLCFIALNQPVTAKEIEEGRGLTLFKGILDSLLDNGFIRTSLRKTNSGRAVVYITTDQFLDHFNLSSLMDLPTHHEIKELINSEADDNTY